MKREECYPPEHVTQGWAFHIPVSIFGPALDILPWLRLQSLKRARASKDIDAKPYQVKCKTWSRGLPPHYNFEIGMVFYQTAADAAAPWSHLINRRVLQIASVTSDNVVIRDMTICAGNITAVRMLTTTQDGVARLLQTGSGAD